MQREAVWAAGQENRGKGTWFGARAAVGAALGPRASGARRGPLALSGTGPATPGGPGEVPARAGVGTAGSAGLRSGSAGRPGSSQAFRPAWGAGGRADQCRPCLTQFRMAHFCPEHRCITSRSPKLASLDISTSRQRPVSRLTMGPLCEAGKPSQHGCRGRRESVQEWGMQAPHAHSPLGLGAPTFLCPHPPPPPVSRPTGSRGLPATDLGEVPQPLRWAGHVLALLQRRHAGPAVVHQALGVGQEGGGAQGAQLQQALRAVAHELGAGGRESRVTLGWGEALEGAGWASPPGASPSHRGGRPETALLPACPVPPWLAVHP